MVRLPLSQVADVDLVLLMHACLLNVERLSWSMMQVSRSMADAIVHEITSASGKAVACYENIESQEGCQRLIETALHHFGRLDILINNAGWISFTP